MMSDPPRKTANRSAHGKNANVPKSGCSTVRSSLAAWAEPVERGDMGEDDGIVEGMAPSRVSLIGGRTSTDKRHMVPVAVRNPRRKPRRHISCRRVQFKAHTWTVFARARGGRPALWAEAGFNMGRFG
jgi:hypothetical protein